MCCVSAARPPAGASPGSTELAASRTLHRADLHQLQHPPHLAKEDTVQAGPDRGPVLRSHTVLHCVETTNILGFIKAV